MMTSHITSESNFAVWLTQRGRLFTYIYLDRRDRQTARVPTTKATVDFVVQQRPLELILQELTSGRSAEHSHA